MSVAPISQPHISRRTVKSFAEYEPAERAVDFLSDHGFPVEHVAIVGTGLRYVEQIGKRATTGTAALNGLGMGAVLGLFWGLLFGLFFSTDSGSFFGVLAYGVVIGVIFGAITGAIVHASQGGRRDFDSSAQTRAQRYEIQVEDGFADEAEHVLARMPAL
jgi:hypothetical protein